MKTRELLQELVDAWPEYDYEENQVEMSNEISGADMVEWMDTFRARCKKALDDYASDETHIAIVMDGGLITSIMSDALGVDCVIVDYDAEGSSLPVVGIPQRDGDEIVCESDAVTWFESPSIMPDRVTELWAICINQPVE